MALVAACAGVLAVAPTLWLLCPTFRRNGWRGEKEVPLVINVQDEATGAPVPGATVRVRHPSRAQWVPFVQATTRPDGRSALTAVASARGDAFVVLLPWDPGRHHILGKTERVSFSGGFIQVEADGYETAEVPLSGNSPITVRLHSVGRDAAAGGHDRSRAH